MISTRFINIWHQALGSCLVLIAILITPTPPTLAQVGSDNSSQRFSPLTRTQRFSIAGLERSQRFGIQQVGEAGAVATRQVTSTRPTASPYDQAVNKADQLVKLGSIQRAIEQYRKAIELQPKSAVAYIGLGYAYINMGDYEHAVQELRQALVQSPDNSEAQLNLGVALYNNGDISAAITQYQQAIASDKSPPPQAHYNLALAYGHSGDFDNAIKHYREAIRMRKNNYPEAHNNLGLILEVLGKTKDAETEFHQAVELQRGNYPLAYYNLARFHINNTEYDQAIAALQQAIKYDSKFAEAYLELGNCYLVRSSLKFVDEYKIAISHYRKAIELRNKFYPLAHENLAITLAKQGDKQGALTEYRLAVDQFGGQCPVTLFNLIATIADKKTFLIYNELGRSDNPGNLKSRLKRQDDNSIETTIQFRFGNDLRQHMMDMLALYEELDDEQKAHPDSSYCLGLAYTVAGNFRAAIEEFSRAVVLSKNQDEDARNALIAVMQLAVN